ncbi:hypothetical protein [Sphingomonas sp.]|jgi:hypothetical protein|uniref:hypothetical protein n=1 Tax=Sphingomonas sp. TaxID=28214 RepID=UPI0017D0C70D|nr:hypothetical protein [Sphingomonas sp.]MBA4763094.1 hypothetical protein [Sphingomonas sp.]
MHPLLRHEWAVARGEAALALPGWRDWLMLAVMVALGLALFIASDAAAALHDSRVAAAVGALAGWAGIRAARRRLDHLARESVVAAAALDPVGQRHGFAAVLAFVALALVALGALARPSVIAALLVGQLAGAIAAALLPLRILNLRPRVQPLRRATRSLSPADAVSGYQLFSGHPHWRTVVPLVAALASVGLALFLPTHWNPIVRLAVPAGAVVLAMLAFTRVDADIVVFLARAGHGAWRSAVLHLGASIRYAAILLPLIALFVPHAVWPCAVAVVAIALFTLLRVWSFRAYSKRFADMILLFGVAGGAVLGTSFPPLLVPYVAIVGFALLRRASRATWSMA